MKLRHILFIIFVASLTILLQSHCNELNTRKEIKNNSVTADTVNELDKSIFIIFQDKNDNYWFGSFGNGVYRYDGKTILHFTTKHGLSNNFIRQIQEDSLGRIFFATHGGISMFDGKKISKLIPENTNPHDWKLNAGDLWFMGEPGKNGPYRYDGKSLHSLEFPKHYMADQVASTIPNQKYSPAEIYFIYKDHKGNPWFGTSNFGLCRYDGKNMSWLYEDQLQFVPSGGSFGIRSILEDKNGKFWICNTRYRYTIDGNDSVGKTHRFLKYKKEKGIELKTTNGDDHIYYMSAIEDKTGKIWMTTYKQGIWCYYEENMIRYSVKDGDKEITLFSVYEDKYGNLWLGTHENGAYKFNGKSFEKFKP